MIQKQTDNVVCMYRRTDETKGLRKKAPVRQTVIILSSKAVVVHVTPKSFVSRFVIVMPS